MAAGLVAGPGLGAAAGLEEEPGLVAGPGLGAAAGLEEEPGDKGAYLPVAAAGLEVEAVDLPADQFLVFKNEGILSKREIEGELIVGFNQFLAKGQALLNHNTVHLHGPGSHQNNYDMLIHFRRLLSECGNDLLTVQILQLASLYDIQNILSF